LPLACENMHGPVRPMMIGVEGSRPINIPRPRRWGSHSSDYAAGRSRRQVAARASLLVQSRMSSVTGFPKPPPLPTLPSSCATRASTHLSMIRLAITEMETGEHDRVLLGFFSVAIFGRSFIYAVERLKRWDRPGFLSWYAPWQTLMKNDPVCKFFYSQRDAIIHDVQPLVGVVLGGFGPTAPQVGTIYTPDEKLPQEHRGNPIYDRSAVNLCRLYLALLGEMFEAFHPMAFRLDEPVLAKFYARLEQRIV
jgi:hypothetical protein